ncbi:MAG: hypothetical protein ACRDSF_04770 [Pseudonocardiaceae bacterium]
MTGSGKGKISGRPERGLVPGIVGGVLACPLYPLRLPQVGQLCDQLV